MRPAIVVVGVSLFAVLLFWITKEPNFVGVTPDRYAELTIDYRPQVASLVDGTGRFSTRYPPGFPFVLYGIYRAAEGSRAPLSMWMGVYVLLTTAISALALYVIAQSLWGQRAGVTAAAAWSTYPVGLWLTTYPSSETPFIAVLLGALGLACAAIEAPARRRTWFLLSGVLLGIAMLIRPIGIGLGVLVAGLGLGLMRAPIRVRAQAGALLLFGNLAAVAPWEIWAWSQTGRVLPLSSGGVAGVLDGLTYAVDPTEARRISVPPDERALQTDIYRQQHRELNSTSSIAAFLAAETIDRPLAVGQLVLGKVTRSWYGTDSSRYERALFFLQLVYIPVLVLGLLGCLRAGERPRRWAIICAATVAYFWFMTVTSLSIVRYMVPAIALLFVCLPGVRHVAWTSGIGPQAWRIRSQQIAKRWASAVTPVGRVLQTPSSAPADGNGGTDGRRRW